MSRKRRVPGQINLLTNKLEDLVVEVSEVDEERGAVTVRSVEEYTRRATFLGGVEDGRVWLHKISGWLTHGEYRHAQKLLRKIFADGEESGRFT